MDNQFPLFPPPPPMHTPDELADEIRSRAKAMQRAAQRDRRAQAETPSRVRLIFRRILGR